MPKPDNTKELREGIMLELRDVARKAQVDYVAVNHPNGIRSGESPEFLGEFLKVNHERIMQLITTHTAKQKEDWEKEARLDVLEKLKHRELGLDYGDVTSAYINSSIATIKEKN